MHLVKLKHSPRVYEESIPTTPGPTTPVPVTSSAEDYSNSSNGSRTGTNSRTIEFIANNNPPNCSTRMSNNNQQQTSPEKSDSAVLLQPITERNFATDRQNDAFHRMDEEYADQEEYCSADEYDDHDVDYDEDEELADAEEAGHEGAKHPNKFHHIGSTAPSPMEQNMVN